jgi:hypothetical protein
MFCFHSPTCTRHSCHDDPALTSVFLRRPWSRNLASCRRTTFVAYLPSGTVARERTAILVAVTVGRTFVLIVLWQTSRRWWSRKDSSRRTNAIFNVRNGTRAGKVHFKSGHITNINWLSHHGVFAKSWYINDWQDCTAQLCDLSTNKQSQRTRTRISQTNRTRYKHHHEKMVVSYSPSVSPTRSRQHPRGQPRQ